MGRWGLEIADKGLRSYGEALFARFLGMTTEESEELCQKAYEEFLRRDVHAYLGM